MPLVPALLLAATIATEPAAVPEGTGTGVAQATKGTTDVAADQGKFSKVAAADKASKDATELDVTLGGLFHTGNARSIAVTTALRTRVRRDIHEFGAGFASNNGRADTGDGWEETVRNIQGRVRYDVFFPRASQRFSFFLMETARHDPFQGLDLRNNVDPGFGFFVLTKINHRLWFEAGYDYQFDLRTDEARIVLDDMEMDTGERLDATRETHASRVFAGYANRLNERVTFDTGLEYLQALTDGARLRVNYDAALTTQLFERLSIALSFSLRYDNDPLPDVEKLDTITAANLVYRFF
jgi:putative salt-induced outer membrane protein